MPGALVSVAYLISWGIYARNFNVWNIDPRGLTHINYAFANIADGEIVLGDPWADVEKVNSGQGDSWSDPPDYLHGNFYQLYRLKQAYRWIKTGISVGGWTWSGDFSRVASTAVSRSRFVASAISFVLTYGMDYIDLDWEYPVSGGLPNNTRSPDDGANLVLLLQEFRRQFALYPRRRLQITMAISCGMATLPNYPFAQMDPHIDYYNMMCYDFSGAFSSTADHQSNLFGRTAQVDSIQRGVEYALSQGASRSKLVVGIPLYGHDFASTAGLTAPFSGVGPGTWEPGIYDYSVLPLAGCTPLWEPISNASFCYSPSARTLVSYDTPTSVSYKLHWLLAMGLGGCMFWELSADQPFSSTQSLQRMIYTWLGPYLDRSENELCYPMSPHGNINEQPGCPTPSKRSGGRAPTFRASRRYLEEHDPVRSEADQDYLCYPRAHYNYTSGRWDTDRHRRGRKGRRQGATMASLIPIAAVPLPLPPHDRWWREAVVVMEEEGGRMRWSTGETTKRKHGPTNTSPSCS